MQNLDTAYNEDTNQTFANQIYKSLMRRYKDQPVNEIFAHFGWKKDEESRETPYEKLAALAKKEEWDFINDEFKNPKDRFPILANYLNYTFLRAQELNLIAYSSDETRACFNTGLQTGEAPKDIYAIFFKNKRAIELTRPQWTLYCFADSYSDKLKSFSSLPDLPTYISDASDLVFDVKLGIELNYDHIIDGHNESLPVELQNNKTLAIRAIEGSVNALKDKIKRNYKIAIPQWYQSKIQLLLPLNITSEEKADLALVADKDKERNIYRVRTALPMDKAYINARLITRPDRDWLNP